MFYTYILKSKRDYKLYVGYSSDLVKRMEEHNKGNVISTKDRRPFELVYYEACRNEEDAIAREKYFKTGFGRRFLNNRLESYFSGWRWRAGKEKQKVTVKKARGGVLVKD